MKETTQNYPAATGSAPLARPQKHPKFLICQLNPRLFANFCGRVGLYFNPKATLRRRRHFLGPTYHPAIPKPAPITSAYGHVPLGVASRMPAVAASFAGRQAP